MTRKNVAAYLAAFLQACDPALLASALGSIARVRGMTPLAKDTGLSRQSLCRSLSGKRVPSSHTLFKVFKVLDLQLNVHSAQTAIQRIC